MSKSTTARRIPSRIEISTRVRGIIADQMCIGPDSFPESASLCTGAGLGLDPIDVAELAGCMEDSFEIEVPNELADGMPIHTATVGQLIDLVEGAIE